MPRQTAPNEEFQARHVGPFKMRIGRRMPTTRLHDVLLDRKKHVSSCVARAKARHPRPEACQKPRLAKIYAQQNLARYSFPLVSFVGSVAWATRASPQVLVLSPSSPSGTTPSAWPSPHTARVPQEGAIVGTPDYISVKMVAFTGSVPPLEENNRLVGCSLACLMACSLSHAC